MTKDLSVRTVYNRTNMEFESGKYDIFMGPPLGLHDSINITYPELDRLYKVQRSQTWTEDEIKLEQSRLDMMPLGRGGKTRPEEIDILVKAVSYLWEADSIASRSVLTLFAPFLSNSEATLLLTEHTRFEGIHALTYSEIVRQCILDTDKLIYETIQNDEILNRTTLIIEAFDDLVKYGALYNLGDTTIPRKKYMEVIYRGLMSLLLLERVQFMSSFAVVFGLAEHDKFKGIADLVKLISKDEALHAIIVSTIMNLLRRNKEWDDLFIELTPTFLAMTKEIVDREFQWNEYLFSEGRSMVGLNTELLNEWVLYSTEEMCKLINIPYEFEVVKENPIPWSDSWFEFDKVQNANQESDNISYRVNTTLDDLGDDIIEI